MTANVQGTSGERAATEYICVAENREGFEGDSTANDFMDGARLGLVQSTCEFGLLPCNEYPDFALLPCVVCSK